MENVIENGMEVQNEMDQQIDETVDTIVENGEDTKTSIIKKGALALVGALGFIGGIFVRPIIDKGINNFKDWRAKKKEVLSIEDEEEVETKKKR